MKKKLLNREGKYIQKKPQEQAFRRIENEGENNK